MSWNTLDPERQAFITSTLTPRQLEILRLRIDGHSFQRIADALNLDEATIRGHHKRAKRRLENAAQEQTT